MTATRPDYAVSTQPRTAHDRPTYQHANQCRAAFRAACRTRSEDGDLWNILEEDVKAYLTTCIPPSLDDVPVLTRASTAFTGRVEDALLRADPSRSCSLAFTRAVEVLRRDTEVWPREVSPAVAAHARYAALVWLGLWHLVSAGVLPAVVDFCVGRTCRQPPPPPAPSIAAASTARRSEPASPQPGAVSQTAEPRSAPKPAQPASSRPSDRSVLAGTLELNARNVRQSTFGTAFGLAVSAFCGAIIFCVIAAMFWGMVNPLVALTWFASMPIAIIAAILWGLVVADLTFRGASRSVVNAMGVTLLPETHPLSQQLRQMCAMIWLDVVPALGVYPSDDINGFAVGAINRSPVIAFSSGALEQLAPDEQSALLAHELGHIAANDSAKLIYAQCFQRSLVWWMLISPLKALGRWLFSTIGEMMILGLSRSREYRADAFGAAVAGTEHMVSLLQTLQRSDQTPPAAARIAPELFIRATGSRWFKTHPALDDRISALRQKRYHRELGAKNRDPQAARKS